MDKIALIALKKSGAPDISAAIAAKEAAQAAQEAAETAQGKAEDAAEELEGALEDIEELQSDVSELQTDVSDLKSALGAEAVTLTTGSYIKNNGGVGSTVSLTPQTNASYRYAVVNCSEGDIFIIENILGGSNPRLYSFLDSNNAIIDAAGSSWDMQEAYLLTAPANSAKVVFNDHKENFPGTIYKGYTVPYLISQADNLEISGTNAATNFFGGASRIPFIQGSVNTGDNGYARHSFRNDRCTTYLNAPVMLSSGDVINCSSGYRFLAYRESMTKSGITLTQYTSSWATSAFTIADDGLFLIVADKGAGTTVKPAEAKENVWVEHKSYKPEYLFTLSRDPYQNIVWGHVQDITSTTHAHCTTQAEFDTLQAHYDHVAISNYHPSFPYYPLGGYFTDTGDTLASPNAEHFHFAGSPSALHMNSVGSYLTSDEDYDGTAFNMIRNADKSLKLQSGGGCTINHPAWSELTKGQIEELLLQGGVLGIEIWNATAENLTSTGDATSLWDAVLSDGLQCYGLAVPDHEAQNKPNEDRHPFGYNHILAVNKTEEEILSAYRMGHFYTTLYNDGLTLEELTISSGTVSIEVSESSTITFKTAARTVSSTGTTATFETQDGDIYVRVEASRGTNKLYTNAIFL